VIDARNLNSYEPASSDAAGWNRASPRHAKIRFVGTP
jgi:hypothetical protein